MGKNSLIKSTAKKKNDDSKTNKPASTKASKTKATQAPKKTKSVKAAAKKTGASKKDRTALLFKQFTTGKFSQTSSTSAQSNFKTPPPFIQTSDPSERERIRALLFRRYSMAEIVSMSGVRTTDFAKVVPHQEDLRPDIEQAQSIPLSIASTETGPPLDQNGSGLPLNGEPTDPLSRMVKYAAVIFAAVIIILLVASYQNSQKYFVVEKDNGIEIWRGEFAPMGKRIFTTLEGYNMSEPLLKEYHRQEIYPLIFSFYLDKADTLLEVQTRPDFEAIETHLHNAQEYALLIV